eukprot:c45103_g1_i1 orf=1-240(-)
MSIRPPHITILATYSKTDRNTTIEATNIVATNVASTYLNIYFGIDVYIQSFWAPQKKLPFLLVGHSIGQPRVSSLSLHHH